MVKSRRSSPESYRNEDDNTIRTENSRATHYTEGDESYFTHYSDASLGLAKRKSKKLSLVTYVPLGEEEEEVEHNETETPKNDSSHGDWRQTGLSVRIKLDEPYIQSVEHRSPEGEEDEASVDTDAANPEEERDDEKLLRTSFSPTTRTSNGSRDSLVNAGNGSSTRNRYLRDRLAKARLMQKKQQQDEELMARPSPSPKKQSSKPRNFFPDDDDQGMLMQKKNRQDKELTVARPSTSPKKQSSTSKNFFPDDDDNASVGSKEEDEYEYHCQRNASSRQTNRYAQMLVKKKHPSYQEPPVCERSPKSYGNKKSGAQSNLGSYASSNEVLSPYSGSHTNNGSAASPTSYSRTSRNGDGSVASPRSYIYSPRNGASLQNSYSQESSVGTYDEIVVGDPNHHQTNIRALTPVSEEESSVYTSNQFVKCSSNLKNVKFTTPGMAGNDCKTYSTQCTAFVAGVIKSCGGINGYKTESTYSQFEIIAQQSVANLANTVDNAFRNTPQAFERFDKTKTLSSFYSQNKNNKSSHSGNEPVMYNPNPYSPREDGSYSYARKQEIYIDDEDTPFFDHTPKELFQKLGAPFQGASAQGTAMLNAFSREFQNIGGANKAFTQAMKSGFKFDDENDQSIIDDMAHNVYESMHTYYGEEEDESGNVLSSPLGSPISLSSANGVKHHEDSRIEELTDEEEAEADCSKQSMYDVVVKGAGVRGAQRRNIMMDLQRRRMRTIRGQDPEDGEESQPVQKSEANKRKAKPDTVKLRQLYMKHYDKIHSPKENSKEPGSLTSKTATPEVETVESSSTFGGPYFDRGATEKDLKGLVMDARDGSFESPSRSMEGRDDFGIEQRCLSPVDKCALREAVSDTKSLQSCEKDIVSTKKLQHVNSEDGSEVDRLPSEPTKTSLADGLDSETDAATECGSLSVSESSARNSPATIFENATTGSEEMDDLVQSFLDGSDQSHSASSKPVPSGEIAKTTPSEDATQSNEAPTKEKPFDGKNIPDSEHTKSVAFREICAIDSEVMQPTEEIPQASASIDNLDSFSSCPTYNQDLAEENQLQEDSEEPQEDMESLISSCDDSTIFSESMNDSECGFNEVVHDRERPILSLENEFEGYAGELASIAEQGEEYEEEAEESTDGNEGHDIYQEPSFEPAEDIPFDEEVDVVPFDAEAYRTSIVPKRSLSFRLFKLLIVCVLACFCGIINPDWEELKSRIPRTAGDMHLEFSSHFESIKSRGFRSCFEDIRSQDFRRHFEDMKSSFVSLAEDATVEKFVAFLKEKTPDNCISIIYDRQTSMREGEEENPTEENTSVNVAEDISLEEEHISTSHDSSIEAETFTDETLEETEVDGDYDEANYDEYEYEYDEEEDDDGEDHASGEVKDSNEMGRDNSVLDVKQMVEEIWKETMAREGKGRLAGNIDQTTWDEESLLLQEETRKQAMDIPSFKKKLELIDHDIEEVGAWVKELEEALEAAE